MFIPLNNMNFKIGDSVTCIENRYARTYNYINGFRTYSNETIRYLTLQKNYKVVDDDKRRHKVTIVGDDDNEYKVPYYRMGVYMENIPERESKNNHIDFC